MNYTVTLVKMDNAAWRGQLISEDGKTIIEGDEVSSAPDALRNIADDYERLAIWTFGLDEPE